MKKMVLVLMTMMLFMLTVNADVVTGGKCPHWEHGNVVVYKGVQYNVAGTAPPAFCWDIVKIKGKRGFYNGKWYEGEELPYSTSILHWYGFEQKYVYGDLYYGIYVKVQVFGYPQSEPIVKLGSAYGILVKEKEKINSTSGKIVNGYEYTFFLRKILASKATYISDIKINDYVRVYVGTKEKDVVYIK